MTIDPQSTFPLEERHKLRTSQCSFPLPTSINVKQTAKSGTKRGVEYDIPVHLGALVGETTFHSQLIGMTATETGKPIRSVGSKTLGGVFVLVLQVKETDLCTFGGVVEAVQRLREVLENGQREAQRGFDFNKTVDKGWDGYQGSNSNDAFEKLHWR